MAIQITFPDGNQKSFDAPISGLAIAQGISPGLAKKAAVIQVNGELWDLTRPIDRDAMRANHAADFAHATSPPRIENERMCISLQPRRDRCPSRPLPDGAQVSASAIQFFSRV